MGHTLAKVGIRSPDLSQLEEIELLVDTGLTYSWVPKDRLTKLGIKPKGSWEFKTIDGRILRREIGEAVVECEGEQATTVVVFADDSDEKVLGVHALEGLRLEVDPTTKRLRKVKAILAI
jgi:clan AA aspartic protease